MATIGGHSMSEHLTLPAHSMSLALATNLVGGDYAFIHHPCCIDGRTPARVAPSLAAQVGAANLADTQAQIAQARTLAQTLREHSVPLRSHPEGLPPPDSGEARRAQDWLEQAGHNQSEIIRGIDY
eukprot:11508329-Heterocapsa_arctica.AAC.1